MSQANALRDHPNIVKLQRRLSTPENTPNSSEVNPTAREAAVALMLRTTPVSTLEMLMIRRAEFEGDPWSGNVALPGGRRDPGDDSLEDTVIREVREETAIDLTTDGTILGVLASVQPLSQTSPPLVVLPYVASIRSEAKIVPNQEVAQAFWLPLEELRRSDRWQQTTMTIRGKSRQLPCFRYKDYIVWGMTERILQDFVRYL